MTPTGRHLFSAQQTLSREVLARIGEPLEQARLAAPTDRRWRSAAKDTKRPALVVDCAWAAHQAAERAGNSIGVL
ncbi:hypothetical protein ACIQV2_02625 [Streptomyces globosus]|uniref:hypothetical protein n=1 Tax=Streptomyces globosus TaxID=68209 RepID=UPI003800EA8C